MIGFLAYLPTLAFVPHSLFVLVFLYAIFKRLISSNSLFKQSNSEVSANFTIALLIVLVSLLNFFAKYEFVSLVEGVVPSFLLLPATIFIATVFGKGDAKVLVTLVVIESLVVFIEYGLGISTFFSSLDRYGEIGESDLLYFNKPLGLSYNSSAVASKLFISFMLLDIVKPKLNTKLICQGIFLAAIFLTFNRTVFVAIAIYIAVKYVKIFLENRFTYIKWNVYFLSISFLFLIVLVIGYWNWDLIVDQLTRRTGNIELSGRDKIWFHYASFINENLFLGNHSLKYYFGAFHAHNSFLQLLANNGLIISILYIYLILRNINVYNLPFVIAIFAYCMFQFGIFWGISLMDVVFFSILFGLQSEVKSEKSRLKLELRV